jgi:serine/threonine protein kinase
MSSAFLKTTATVTGYSDLKLLAEGAFGKVYVARDGSGHVVAVKAVDLNEDYSNDMLKMLVTEILVNRLLQGHPNVAEFFTAFSNADHIWLVMKLYQGDLRRLLMTGQPLDVAVARRVAADVLLAVEYMHAKGVVHCDLKPDNVLLDADGSAKVADFGLATPAHLAVEDDHTVTRFYRAPELVCLLPWGRPVDLWSVACILFELFVQCGAGVPPPNYLFVSKGSCLSNYCGPFDTTDLYTILRVVGNPSGPYPALQRSDRAEHRHYFFAEWAALPLAESGTLESRYPDGCTAPAEARALVARLLRLDPLERWSASEALRAPFFDPMPTLPLSDARAMTRHEAADFERVLLMKASHAPLLSDGYKRRKLAPEEALRAQLLEELAAMTV